MKFVPPGLSVLELNADIIIIIMMISSEKKIVKRVLKFAAP